MIPDKYGNPDVMGSRQMTQLQQEFAQLRLELREAFNAVHAKCQAPPGASPECQRLYAVARTQLELACMAAVKAISR